MQQTILSHYRHSLLRFLLLFAVLAPFASHAQQLVVRDWKPRPNDLTASMTATRRLDQNGRESALIRIFTPIPVDRLGFSGSAQGFLGWQQAAPGEVWLFVPRNSQKVTFASPGYEPLTYHYEGQIEGGKTYQLMLMPEGKEVSLVASAPGASIWMDGDSLGVTPQNRYIPFGAHHVRATLGTLLYEDDIDITRSGAERFNLKMEDENLKYGDVVIDVDGAADLWFQGNREGIGRMTAHLYNGDYIVESRKPDHDPQTTAFTVVPGMTTHVTARPPVPHIGYLNLVTVPEHGVSITQADTLFTTERDLQLPVANYELTFSRRGYYPVTRMYRTVKGTAIADTIILRKIQYVPATTGYASVGMTYAARPGVQFALGGLYRNISLEASYLLGLGKTKEAEWYTKDEIYNQSVAYKVDEWAVRAGYQLRFAERFGLTPQAGFMQQMLRAKDKPGNGYSVNDISISARFVWHPVPHFGIYLTPEYAIPVGAKGQITELCRLAGLTRGGFQASLGITVNL